MAAARDEGLEIVMPDRSLRVKQIMLLAIEQHWIAQLLASE
jgi:hypothetical protein